MDNTSDSDIKEDWSSSNNPLVDDEWSSNLENIPVDWVEFEDESNEFYVGDLFIILLKDKDYPILCIVDSIDTKDKTADLINDDKTYIISFDDNFNIKLKTETYEIDEIIKVKEFDLDLDQYKKERDEIEFETEKKNEFEKDYSESVIIDDLLSSLIISYECYDNLYKIEKVRKIVDEFMNLLNKKDKKNKTFNEWLVPIINNENIIHLDEGKDLIDEFIKSNKITGETTYKNILLNQFKIGNNLKFEDKIGYNTSNYSGVCLKECSIDKSCSGINGDYLYDELNIRKSLIVPKSSIFKNEIINEMVEILSSDNINITGFLDEPYNKSYFRFPDYLHKNFNVFERDIYDKYWYNLQNNKYQKFSKYIFTNHLCSEESIEPETLNLPLIYNLSKKVNSEDLNLILNKCTRNKKNIIDLFLKDEILINRILNYDNIHQGLFKYDINYRDLDKKTIKKIDNIIEDNINEYISNKKTKIKKEPIKIRKKPLTDLKRVSLAHDYIFSILSVKRRNELLKDFMNKFTRGSNTRYEDPNFLYNKYNNKKIFCKHYLYLVDMDNSNNVFETMKTKYGCPPLNGKIYCKVCNEYLCDEDYSTLEGFDGDNNIMSSSDVLVTDDKSKDIISEKIEKKKDLVRIIEIIANMIGVVLNEEDIYEILVNYDYLDHNILADNRYGLSNITDSDIHTRLNKSLSKLKEKEKEEKDSKKKDKIKKEKNKIVSKFQQWIKDTNKLLIILSLVSIYIQTSVPVYNIRRGIKFKIIDENDKLNKNGIEFVIKKFKSICNNYDNTIINNSIDLINDNDMSSFEDQLTRTLSYCNSSIFPKVIERKNKYYLFLKSEKKEYIRSEWTTYKPLSNNTLILSINDYLKEIDNTNLKTIYGGISIENISIVRGLNNNSQLADILEIPNLKILVNSSFKKLFRFVVSCYGRHENNILINLLVQNLIETIDKKEEILTILTKYNWNKDSKSFTKLSFKDLRQNVVPKILNLYSKNDTEIKSCFSNEFNCNSFIHTSVNNYDLHLLNTLPKRIYSYIPPNIYPQSVFTECDNKKELSKLFDNYRFDPEGNIISKIDNINFINKYLIDIPDSNELIEIDEYGKKITQNNENFKLLLEYIRKEKSLKYNNIYPIIHKYDEENYNDLNKLSYTYSRLIQYLSIVIDDKENLEEQYGDKIPQISESEVDIDDNKILYIHYKTIENYYLKLLENKPVLKIKDSFDSIYSEYIKIYKNDISRISKFLSENDFIGKDQKLRFEKIFSNEKKLKFNEETISIILNKFLDSNLEYTEFISYFKDIQNIIVHLNKDPTLLKDGTIMTNKIPKHWKLTDSIQKNMMNYLEKEEMDNFKPSLLLHNRILIQPRNDSYLGFNYYSSITSNYHAYFKNMYSYLSKYFENLELLKANNKSYYTDKYSKIYCKYHFIKILSTIVDYIEGLMLNQGEVVNDAMPLYRLLEGRVEELIDENIKVCSLFLMDLLTHLLMSNYDPNWIYMNKNKLTFQRKLSKQNEKEKQERIEKIHNATPEERLLMKYKQETGQSNWHKEASDSHLEYINSEEYSKSTDEERNQKIKEIYIGILETYDDVDIDNVNIPNLVPDNEEKEEGYFNENELNEDNEEFLDDYDEEQEMEFNE
uniref:Uncharacterized protein n=1 Tax=viral metagenome TaxID=1070528 RepID=A0A6C0BSM6_9ZZZZ